MIGIIGLRCHIGHLTGSVQTAYVRPSGLFNYLGAISWWKVRKICVVMRAFLSRQVSVISQCVYMCWERDILFGDHVHAVSLPANCLTRLAQVYNECMKRPETQLKRLSLAGQ